MKHIATKTTYLQMLAPAHQEAEPPQQDISVKRILRPSATEYRKLYNGVGAEYQWIDRNLISEEELELVVQNDRIEIYVLLDGDSAAGFAELDRRRDAQIELAYFGLFPSFIGRGLGKFFLNWIVAKAWSYEPQRVWVHTCDLDHPAALPNYKRAGFEVYDEQVIQQVVRENQ